ncbi:hypothetical protein C2S51_029761 [Perilla frutescens var. frutescens]|nr:hypothetical protein C2S51_029761 [Perilla frutescens var. frutescens]
MSITEGLLILDSQNAVAAIGDKAKEAARPCSMNAPRRMLVDISNLPPKDRLSIQDQKLQSIPTTTKEYIEQLQKENMALVKMLVQRNKIVEQSGIELEKLRLHFIKMKEQNQHLAMSHTHMLAELNSTKDRLKALQHELGCRNGLLHARSSKFEKEKLIEEDESPKEGKDHKKPRNAKRRQRSVSLGSSEQLQFEDNAENRPSVRRQSARFRSIKQDGDTLSEMGDPKCLLPDGTAPSTSVDASDKNEDHFSNRPSVRRQSTRFKSITSKQADDLSEIDDAKIPTYPFPDETVHGNGPTSGDTLIKNEDHAGNRPSTRRQSARFKAVRSIKADDTVEMEEAKFAKCLLPNIPAPVNISTDKNEDHVAQRPSARRQSTRFKAKRPRQADDQLDTDANISPKCSSPDEPVLENGSTSVDTPVKNEDDGSCSGLKCESQEFRKPSLGRPSRVAATKVQCYKEISLKVKMRRPQ